MKKQSQAERLAAMIGGAQSVPRPSNLEAVEPETQQDGKTENRKAVLPEGFNDDLVTVGAKVYRDLAFYWTAQAKLTRRAVSDVVRDALVEAFGLPEGFPIEAVKPENRKTGKPENRK